MPELFVELFSEDIPARMQARAAEDLKRLATEKLGAAGLTFASASVQSTPRRLALVIDGLPLAQPDVREEKRGPRVGAPEQAVQGFLKSAGLASLDQCEKRDTGKGEFWFAVIEKPGRATAQVLPELVEAVIRELPWPKSMRWSDTTFRWVRPLHAIIALFDGKVLEGGLTVASREGAPKPDGAVCMAGEIDVTRLRFGNRTRGHRFLAPDWFEVGSYGEYREKLCKAHVLLDREERKANILAEATRLAASEGLTLEPDDGLLDEVAGLVEWPVVLLGTIDPQFMDVPAEVLITSMRTHQKYFATRTAEGKLGPRFVVVANMITDDGGKAVVAGNQRVLRARLSDARFFWDQDRHHRLDSRLEALKAITFHAKLGTVFEKAERVQVLAAILAGYIPGAEPAAARRAAQLAKGDLTTGMVGEFPELQGVMGRYYALHDGEPSVVADAIAEHYKPLGMSDGAPVKPVSIAVALADKIDSLAGFWFANEKPTGSKDPYALRRAALGVIRIVLENNVRIRLSEILFAAVDRIMTEAYYKNVQERLSPANELREAGISEGVAGRVEIELGGGRVIAANPDHPDMGIAYDPRHKEDAEAIVNSILDFFADRLKVVLRDRGVRHELIDAVFALGGEDDLVRLLARVEALGKFLGSDDGANLVTAYRRAANIARIEEKKDGRSYDGEPDPALYGVDEERRLGSALAAVQAAVAPRLEAGDFAGAMSELARLRAAVDAFFEKVTVNAEDKGLRENRLKLLARIRATMNLIADFSRIEG